ncbi:MAG TPA: hypothetical protein VMY39_08285, partial [Planctomycetota bacterium]|nr:hypothetical protein [Planctomycetota bacterium]
HSVDPDRWAEDKTWPGYTHFIDLDLLDNAPFANIPVTWEAASARYGEARLQKAGTLPWEIARRKDDLTAALREKRWADAVKQSAWIAHFLADATMPLHTTKDYLGRDAGNIVLEERGPNRSVHHRLEWGLIEAFPGEYEDVRGSATEVRHLDDVLAEIWKTVHHSYTLIPRVLAADKSAAGVDDTFGPTYYAALDRAMRPLVEAQMRRSQELVASVWLTAWEDAGRPEPPAGVVIAEVTPETPPERGASPRRSWPMLLPVGLAALLVFLWVLVRTVRDRRGRRPR